MKRDFLTLLSVSKPELERILARAAEFKGMVTQNRCPPLFKGRILGLIFEKSSTRTRVSFEVAMYRLGGTAVYLNQQMSQLGRGESYADTARVLSRYVDLLVLRTFLHADLQELAQGSRVPVINGLTDLFHPCQLVADLFTLQECKKNPGRMTVAYIGDANNMCYSWIHAAELFGFTLNIAVPDDVTWDDQMLAHARELGNVSIVAEPAKAVAGADALYTDTWFSMGQEITEEKKKIFAPFQVNEELVKLARPDAVIMHCLPAHRGEEITDQVMDGTQSVVFQQAENRLYAHMAIMEFLL